MICRNALLWRLGLALAATSGVLVLGGCLAAAPVFAAGATATSAGVSFLQRGKLASYEMVLFEDAIEATRQAGEIHKLRLRRERIEDGWVRLIFRDEQGQDISVRIERRTAVVTGITIDVGRMGRTGMGALLHRQILNELGEMEAYLETWTRDDPRNGGAGTGIQ